MRLCMALFLLLSPVITHAQTAIQQATLSNGLRVLLMEAHNVPMVAMQLVLPSGSRFDPAKKGGTATLMAGMLTDHTKKHDHQAWAAWLDGEAVHLGAGVSRDTLAYSVTVVKEALPVGLDMLAESLLHPAWNGERFAILQQDAIAGATKALETPGYRASIYTAAMIYGDHAYGHRSGGTLETLQRITLNDLKTLYANQCTPQGAVLAVSGDVTLATLMPLLESRLHNWTGTPAVAAHAIATPQAQPVTEKKIAMSTSQMLVQFSRLGIARSDVDFFPMLVLNHLLGGGGFGSILMEEVREKRGLVYGVYSYVMPLLARGPFVITLQTRGDQAAKAIAIVEEQLQLLATGHIDAIKLEKTKSNLIGGFAQRMDSNRERVGLMGMIGFYGLPLNYLQVWTKRIESVNLADVKRAAKLYLPPQAWNRIQLGPVGENK